MKNATAPLSDRKPSPRFNLLPNYSKECFTKDNYPSEKDKVEEAFISLTPSRFVKEYLPSLFISKSGVENPCCYKVAGDLTKQAGRKIQTSCKCLYNLCQYYSILPDEFLDADFYEIKWLANKFHHFRRAFDFPAGVTELIQLSRLVLFKNETFGKSCGRGGKPQFVLKHLEDMLVCSRVIAITNANHHIPHLEETNPDLFKLKSEAPVSPESSLAPLCPNGLQLLLGYNDDFRNTFVSVYSEKLSTQIQDKMKNLAVFVLLHKTKVYLATTKRGMHRYDSYIAFLEAAQRMYYRPYDDMFSVSYFEFKKRFKRVYEFATKCVVHADPCFTFTPQSQHILRDENPEHKVHKVLLDVMGKEAFTYPSEPAHSHLFGKIHHPCNVFCFSLKSSLQVDKFLSVAIDFNLSSEWQRNLQYGPNMEQITNAEGRGMKHRRSIFTSLRPDPVKDLFEYYLEDNSPDKIKSAREFEGQIRSTIFEMERSGSIPPLCRNAGNNHDPPIYMAAGLHGYQWNPNLEAEHLLFRNQGEPWKNTLMERPHTCVTKEKLNQWLLCDEILPLIFLVPINDHGTWIHIWEFLDHTSIERSIDRFLYIPPGNVAVIPATMMHSTCFRTDLACSKYLQVLCLVPLENFREDILQADIIERPMGQKQRCYIDGPSETAFFRDLDSCTQDSCYVSKTKALQFYELLHIFSLDR